MSAFGGKADIPTASGDARFDVGRVQIKDRDSQSEVSRKSRERHAR